MLHAAGRQGLYHCLRCHYHYIDGERFDSALMPNYYQVTNIIWLLAATWDDMRPLITWLRASAIARAFKRAACPHVNHFESRHYTPRCDEPGAFRLRFQLLRRIVSRQDAGSGDNSAATSPPLFTCSRPRRSPRAGEIAPQYAVASPVSRHSRAYLHFGAGYYCAERLISPKAEVFRLLGGI